MGDEPQEPAAGRARRLGNPGRRRRLGGRGPIPVAHRLRRCTALVRHQLGLAFSGAAYPETFLLADVMLSWDLPDDELHILLTPEGSIAAFPLPETGRWRLVDTSGTFTSDDPTTIVDHFRARLHAHGRPEAIVDDPTWSTSFRIHRRVVDRMRGPMLRRGRRRPHPQPGGRAGDEHWHPGRLQPRLEVGLVVAGTSPESRRTPTPPSVSRSSRASCGEPTGSRGS